MADDDAVRQARTNAYHRELERRSMDTFMVYNPTDEDYLLEWDKRYFRVPNKHKNMGFGNGKMELDRYLTEKYAMEMKDKIINDMGKREGEAMIEARKKQGFPDFKDKYVENTEVWNKVVKTDNPELTAKIYGEVVLGLVREYGIDEVPQEKGEPMDTRTIEQRTFDSLNKKYIPDETPEVKPVNVKKKKIDLKEVTNET